MCDGSGIPSNQAPYLSTVVRTVMPSFCKWTNLQGLMKGKAGVEEEDGG